jgi:hypothetical protein
MAGLQHDWNPVVFFSHVQFRVFNCFRDKTEFFQVLAPAFTTASTRSLVNHYGGQFTGGKKW